MDSSKRSRWLGLAGAALALSLLSCAPAAPPQVTVASLLREMVDFENLARAPWPAFTHAEATSFSRESRKGGDAWFDNRDVGQYVRTESRDGRTEYVLADLAGPGALTRFWSANPDMKATVRFYFDGEAVPRLALPLDALFTGKTEPFGPVFSYISGTGGNLYFPLPYAKSLRISVEKPDDPKASESERAKPLRLYYEAGYRTYEKNAQVVTFDARQSAEWKAVATEVAGALEHPKPAPHDGAEWVETQVTIPPGETRSIPSISGEKAVYQWSARVLGTRESTSWDDPLRAHNAWRFLLLDIRFDGERSILTPLGDFFGSGPGVNAYQGLFFTVGDEGTMTSRLLMPFEKSMDIRLSNVGTVPYRVSLRLLVGTHRFTTRDYHLHAQWGALTRDSWPPFDWNVLEAKGEGKVVGTVYQIANPVLIWWGEGDQRVSVDGEAFPSTFGTGTEDDYGFAYGDNNPFMRPYHAQTRVDGPWSGGHISLNRWFVLDAIPFRQSIRFDQEMWHWMPCRPTWSHVVYWYARPGSTGPAAIERATLAPVDLGIRANMLEPFEAEALAHRETSGKAAKERLANCSGAEHLVWQGAKVGGRMTVHFNVPAAGRYSITLNICQSPRYGRHQFLVNGKPAGEPVDGYSPTLFWTHPTLGTFELKAGDNVLTAVALPHNPNAEKGNALGLDYVFCVRQ